MSREKTLPRVEVLREGRRLPLALVLWGQMARRKPLAFTGALLVLALILTAILADVIATFPYDENHPREALASPSSKYLLGTDDLGRDVLSRLVYGARVSMFVGVGATLLAIAISVALGVTSAYFGGWLDNLLQRLVDIWMSLPNLVILLTMMAFLGPGLLNITLALGFSEGIRESRVIRGSALAVKEETYVEASRALGCSSLRIILAHLLPNIMAPVIILATAILGALILAEASLSFLGYGVPPPYPSWGSIISGAGRHYIYEAPWVGIAPGIAISMAVFGWNMLGDGLRDLLDPRLRGAGKK